MGMDLGYKYGAMAAEFPKKQIPRKLPGNFGGFRFVTTTGVEPAHP
jgi:hypothetical protein